MRTSIAKKVFEVLVVIAASLYFVVDAVTLSILKPLLREITTFGFFQRTARWIASLGRYPTLILFLVPYVLLEPIKPFSAYLVAAGHFRTGALILILGEILKIMIVERIFHIGRKKLMTIKAFAWAFNFVVGWLNWLRGLPPWQAVKRRVRTISIQLSRPRLVTRRHGARRQLALARTRARRSART